MRPAKTGSWLGELVAENLSLLGIDFYLEIILVCSLRRDKTVKRAARPHDDSPSQLIHLSIVLNS